MYTVIVIHWNFYELDVTMFDARLSRFWRGDLTRKVWHAFYCNFLLLQNAGRAEALKEHNEVTAVSLVPVVSQDSTRL